MRLPLWVVQFVVVLCWAGHFLQAQQMEKTDSDNNQASSYFFYQRPEYPKDCADVRDQCSSDTTDGVYLIKPDGYPEPFEVYCNNTYSEGWTVLLRRKDGFVDVNRTWDEYNEGFGFLSQDYWIGNERLSYITNQKNYEIRIDLTNSNGLSCYIAYDLFRTSDDFGNYKISNLGQYSGNADDCFSFCPSNMEPGDCSCQRTCSNPNVCVNNCDTDDNCVCSNGFYLKEEECVPISECTSGCLIDGVNVPEGGFYVNDGCTRRGVCNNGQFTWDDTYMCSSNEVCEERNNVRQCYLLAMTDCFDIYNAGLQDSGVYNITPTNWSGSPFPVYCNMTDGGGWTVFQHREDGSVDFYQNWKRYKEGFGSPSQEYWLGNDKLYYLTNQKRYTIRIDLVNLDGSPYYAKFDFFRINDETDNYRLTEVGDYSGTADERGSTNSNAGYALTYHRGSEFSTHDRDNDIYDYNCASNYHGGWWYDSFRDSRCYYSNLNGRYDVIGFCSVDDMQWSFLPGSNCNKYVEMKIRPF